LSEAAIDERVRPAAPAAGSVSFGHPTGLWYLVLTEVWERFSYFGLTANLVLYMNLSLLQPDQARSVIGLDAMRAGLEAVLGPLTNLALASQIFGLYAGFVYFTPILGGLIADRWLGRRICVVAGAVLMSLGHFAMAFTSMFLLALLLLILGCGLLKGNISTQVGELYATSDEAGRTRGFTLLSVGINIGAIAGPLLCGLLASWYGWHAGFAAAGVLMLVGLATYLAGYRHLPESLPKRATGQRQAEVLSRRQRTTVLWLCLVIAITVLTSVACYQKMNIGMIWIDQHVDLDVLGFKVPVSWFAAIGPIASIIGVPLLFALWDRQSERGRKPTEMGKIVTGAWLAAASNAVLAAICLFSGRPSWLVPLGYTAALGLAYLYYWPALMALVARAAPPRLKGTLMSCVFLSLFAANIIIGWLGKFYDDLGPAGFWALEAAVGVVGALLAVVLKERVEARLVCP
jgi:POT family proton-dependent oligopeptide transporter